MLDTMQQQLILWVRTWLPCQSASANAQITYATASNEFEIIRSRD